jgi:hypothetical protein
MAQNAIYYPFFEPPNTGGDFVNLEHITGLNRLGFNAKAIYPSSALDHPHFSIPTVKAADVNVTEHDIVVVGELNRELFGRLKSVKCIKVMHNQNPYYTFLGFDTVQQLNAYPLSHIITSSEFIKRTLQDLGVTKPIFVVLPYIPSIFRRQKNIFRLRSRRPSGRASRVTSRVFSNQDFPNWRTYHGYRWPRCRAEPAPRRWRNRLSTRHFRGSKASG